MSKALKCDRCGECFVPEETEYEATHFLNPAMYDGMHAREKRVTRYLIEPGPMASASELMVDLCPKCTWYFKKFMAGHNFTIEVKENENFEEFLADFPANEMNCEPRKRK